MSLALDNILYFPALRTGQNEINALLEIDEARRKKISPILSIRKNIDFTKKILENWSESPIFVGISSYGQDSLDDLIIAFNNQDNWLKERIELFTTLKEFPQVIPVINICSHQNIRDFVQLTRFLINNFDHIALKIDLGLTKYTETLSKANSLFSFLTDDELKKTILIIDSFNSQSADTNYFILDLIKEHKKNVINKLKLLITLSSSWPRERPEKGQSVSVNCKDPLEHAVIKAMVEKLLDITCHYGDYASTSPTDLMDEFDPSRMSPPVPFAGYLLKDECSWRLIRQGSSGQNEKFREIAAFFVDYPGFHGKDFCWATQTIYDIKTGERSSAGNASYWIKIRVNQHICAMLENIENNLIDQYIEHMKENNHENLEE